MFDSNSFVVLQSLPNLNEWVLALGALLGSFMLAEIIRTILKSVRFGGRWKFAGELAPSLANLVYIVGLAAAAELAPLKPGLGKWIEGGTYVIAAIIILALVRRVAMAALEWGTARASTSPAVTQGFIPLGRNLITLFILFSGAIMILRHFNYDVLSLLTALGVGSLAIGLAAKDTLSNMISGFTVIIDRNFTPGDRINLGGLIGDVEEIGLRSTRMRMGDGNMLIVPNSELVNTKILNLSLPSRAIATSCVLKVPFTVSFESLRETCLKILDQDDRVRATRRPPTVLLASLADGAETVTVNFWLEDLDQVASVQSLFHERILVEFTRQGIQMIRTVQ